VQIKGTPNPDADKLALIRRAGYPAAVLTLPRNSILSTYMQFIHYVVFGIGRLRRTNFVTQPSVELHKSIAGRIHAEAMKAGGIEKSPAWLSMILSPRQARWRGGVTVHYDRLRLEPPIGAMDAAAIYAGFLRELAASRAAEYGELTFFGDTRYSPGGRAVRACLDRAAEHVFRSRLKMPADVGEGPAMNHSFHEMVLGRGRCFSTIVVTEKAECLPEAGVTADYHRAQFLATLVALSERKRAVVAITLRDIGERTLEALDEFYRQVASHLKTAV
jgi:hypothetical protein